MIALSWIQSRRWAEPALPALTVTPPVAILYPTRNDFRESAAESCRRQDYPACHLFILDDSTLEEYQEAIDRWASNYPAQVTVIRRPAHQGYKAGNLNHGLKAIGPTYPFFAVSDADGVLPPSFISTLMPSCAADARVAYVQAKQEGRPDQPEPFGRDMGFAVKAHYHYYVRPRHRYGFVMFYGHGALLRTSVWEEIGGFPEIATEDLAYAAKARAAGYYGLYTERTASYEDYPPTYRQLRTRTEKWIRGTSEFLASHAGGFLTAPHIPWFEKLDMLINAWSHYQSVIMLVCLLALGVLLPSHFNAFRYPGSFLLMPVAEGKSAVEYLAQVRYHLFWSLDFYLAMMLTIAGPMLPALVELRRRPSRLCRYLIAAQFVFLGTLVADASAVAAFLLTGRAVFRNTHDAAELQRRDAIAAAWRRTFHVNHPIIYTMEALCAALLGVMAYRARNLWFLAPMCALAVSWSVYRFGWHRRWLRPLTALPVLAGVVVLVLITIDVVTGWLAGGTQRLDPRFFWLLAIF